jgi:membrane fusion protein (multidrug efflux system)
MVLKPDDTADMRKVELGQRQGENVVVVSGVNAGERVITAGQSNVLPGSRVRIAPPNGQQTAPPSPGAPQSKGN